MKVETRTEEDLELLRDFDVQEAQQRLQIAIKAWESVKLAIQQEKRRAREAQALIQSIDSSLESLQVKMGKTCAHVMQQERMLDARGISRTSEEDEEHSIQLRRRLTN